ncbi:MAG: quinone-dependent dihydroorotate dehydrogenase [Bacteroidia bacterium]
MYKLIIKPFFFLFDPERIHHFVFRSLKLFFRIPGTASLMSSIFQHKDKRLERTVFGIHFSNPVGLAAGFDKDAKLFDELGYFGFGHIEIGTLTPKPQPGNPKPRMFRLPADEALINRMGFNNEGVEAAVQRLRKRKSPVVIGGNLGRNKITPNEGALLDYEYCFEALFDYVDYFVLNVSSPNTPGLRELQEKEPLKALLIRMKELNAKKEKPKPILLKIAPDLTLEQLDDIIELVLSTGTDGVIATNTTIERGGLRTPEEKVKSFGAGGLSGKPLTARSTEVIRYLHKKSGAAFPIIGVGGIHSAEDAIAKLNAGASLVQVYTGFIYEGPGLARKINEGILASMGKK